MKVQSLVGVVVAFLIAVMSAQATRAAGSAQTPAPEPLCGVLKMGNKVYGVRKVVGQNPTSFKIVDPKYPNAVVSTPKSKTNPKEGVYLLSIRNCSFYGIGSPKDALAAQVVAVPAAPAGAVVAANQPQKPNEESQTLPEPWHVGDLITPMLVVIAIVLMIFLSWRRLVGLYHKLRHA